MKFKLTPLITSIFTTLMLSFIGIGCNTESSSRNHATWKVYAGGPDQSKYFDGAQITKENVSQLKVIRLAQLGSHSHADK